jgi:hypothetical protein
MAVDFADLWRNHPSNASPADNAPCKKRSGASAFENQCVIRLGEALTRSGVDLSPFRGTFCWHRHGKRHPLKVEQFKHYVDSDNALFAPYYADKYVKTRSGLQKTYHHFLGSTGIVCFRNFWGAGNRGDHIDLWNGARVAHGDLDFFERSKEIWFWQID